MNTKITTMRLTPQDKQRIEDIRYWLRLDNATATVREAVQILWNHEREKNEKIECQQIQQRG